MKPIYWKPFTRASTAEQGRKGTSHGSQLHWMKESYRVQGWIALDPIHDTISGTKSDRKKIEQFYQDCLHGRTVKPKYLLFRKVDRYFRNLNMGTEYFEKFRKIGIEINFTDEWLEYHGDAMAIFGFKLGRAQDESNRISDNSKKGIHYARANGYWTGNYNPRGYERYQVTTGGIAGNRFLLRKTKEHSRLIKSCLTDYSKDIYSKSRLFDTYGKKLSLSRSQFYKLFENPAYCAHNAVEDRETGKKVLVPAKWEAYITYAQFQKNQRIAKNRNRLKSAIPSKKGKTKYWLKDHLYDSITGRAMSASASTSKSGKKHPYYHTAKQQGQRLRANEVHKLFLSVLSRFSIKKEYLPVIEKKLAEKQKNDRALLESEKGRLMATLSKILAAKANISEMFTSGEITPQEWRELKGLQEIKESELTAKLQEVEKALNSRKNKILGAIRKVSNIKSLFNSSSSDYKDKIIKAIFPAGFFVSLEHQVVRTPLVNPIFLQLIGKQEVIGVEIIKDDLLLQTVPKWVELRKGLERPNFKGLIEALAA